MNHTLFNFVIDCSDSELEAYINLDEANAVHISAVGDLSWCLHAYLMLSQNPSLNVVCSNRLIQEAINIVHPKRLSNINGNPLYFIVSVQADYPRCPRAHFHLVQNKTQTAKNALFVPHWVQPGLVKRKSDRDTVQKVAFLGPLPSSFFPFQGYLKQMDIELVSMQGSWFDLSDVDVLVGVRSYDSNPHNNKPPNRLFSSWHAHIPFIGGCDSAYQQVAAPAIDYLVAQTPLQVIEAVIALKNNPQLYSQLVQNGIEKTKHYNNDAIAALWKCILSGPVMQQYTKWSNCLQYN